MPTRTLGGLTEYPLFTFTAFLKKVSTCRGCGPLLVTSTVASKAPLFLDISRVIRVLICGAGRLQAPRRLIIGNVAQAKTLFIQSSSRTRGKYAAGCTRQ